MNYWQRNSKFIIWYTIIFIGIVALVFGRFALNGKTIIFKNDCFSAYYELLGLRKSIWNEFVTNIVEFHRFTIPFVNLNLTGDDNLFGLIGIEVFDILYFLFPQSAFEYIFAFIGFARLWCAGYTFALFARYKFKVSWKIILVASFVYSFSGYGIIATFKQPFFVSMMYYFPLILLGVEKEIEEKKRGILVLFVALSAITSFYLHYYTMISVSIYCILRVLGSKDNNRMEKRRILLGLAGNYLLGFSLSLFWNLHIIITILGGDKVASTNYGGDWWFYGKDLFIHGAEYFFGIAELQNYTWIGISVISLPIIIYLFLRKDKKNLKMTFCTSLILMNIPLWGKIAGVSTVNNRWMFVFSFIVAWCILELAEDLFRKITVAEKTIISVLSLIYALLLLLLGRSNNNMKAIMIAISVLFVIGVLNICWNHKRSNIIKRASACVTVIVCCLLVSRMIDTDNMLDWGTANEYAESFVDYKVKQISDENFYRIDRSNNQDFFSEMNCNLPKWFDFVGVSSFGNLVNEAAVDYLRTTGNPGLFAFSKIGHLDGRTSDEILACSKYYLKDTVEVIPYRYEKKYEGVYGSQDWLPIGYTYSSVMSREEFENMNVAEQQECLLRTVTVDRKIQEEEQHFEKELFSVKLKTQSLQSEGVKNTGSRWCVTNESATLKYRIDVPDNCELYVEVQGMDFESNLKAVISVRSGDIIKKGFCYGTNADYSTGQKTISFNMGSNLNEEEYIEIEISNGKNLCFENINVYARKFDTFLDDVKGLREESMTDVVIGSNYVSGKVNVSNKKYLVFSIPYSKGWKCCIDGEKVDIYKANIMYMGIDIWEGDHEIELRYFPYGMKLGSLISCLAIIILIVQWAMNSFNIIRRKGKLDERKRIDIG